MWQHVQEFIDELISRLMDNLYQKLNKKLDVLTNQTNTKHNNNEKNSKFQSQVINLTNIKFTREQIQTLTLDPNYAIEEEPKQYINELIKETENAIRHLEPKIQNNYQYLATKQVKHITMTNRHSTLHKRYKYNINELKKTLQNNNLTIVKADRSKAIVIIDRNTLIKKVDNFIQDNNIKQINKDPTNKYQRQIQQTIQRCNLPVDKQTYKYLTNIKPMA